MCCVIRTSLVHKDVDLIHPPSALTVSFPFPTPSFDSDISGPRGAAPGEREELVLGSTPLATFFS